MSHLVQSLRAADPQFRGQCESALARLVTPALNGSGAFSALTEPQKRDLRVVMLRFVTEPGERQRIVSTCALLTAARAGVIAVVPGAGPPVDYTIPDASADLQAGAIAALRIEIQAE